MIDYKKEFKKYIKLQKTEAYNKQVAVIKQRKLARTIAWGYNGTRRAKSQEVLLKTSGRLWRRKLRKLNLASKG